MEARGGAAGLRRLHDVHVRLVERGHEDVSGVAVLGLKVADAAAGIPDDVVPLPVFPERLGEEVVGFVHDVEGRVVGALEGALVVGNEAVAALEEVVAVLGLGRARVDRPKSAVAVVVAELVEPAVEEEGGAAVFVEELGGEIFVGGDGAVAHDVGEEEEAIILGGNVGDFAADHFDPAVEDLLEVVGRDLCADDFTGGDGGADGFDELPFLRLDAEGDEVRADVLRDGVEGFGRERGRGFAPADGFRAEERERDFRLHEGGFHAVDDAEKGRNFLAFVESDLHVVEQLREHGVGGDAEADFRLEPDFLGLDVDEVFLISLETEGFDVGVFDVFFGRGGSEFFEKGHERKGKDFSGTLTLCAAAGNFL